MDIIEEAENVAIQEQKKGITQEIFDTYESLLDFTLKLIIEQRKVINGEGDKQLLEELYKELDNIDNMAKAIDVLKAGLKED